MTLKLTSFIKKVIMFAHLRKLQNKPEHIRRSIALTAALVITVPIFYVWVATFQFRFSPSGSVQVAQSVNTTRSPFSLIGDAREGFLDMLGGIGGFYTDIKMQFGGLGNIESVMNPEGFPDEGNTPEYLFRVGEE